MAVRITKSIAITHSADEWSLYEGQGYEDREHIAVQINIGVAQAINTHYDNRSAAAIAANNVLAKYDTFGAADTEGRWKLQQIINEFFGG